MAPKTIMSGSRVPELSEKKKAIRKLFLLLLCFSENQKAKSVGPIFLKEDRRPEDIVRRFGAFGLCVPNSCLVVPPNRKRLKPNSSNVKIRVRICEDEIDMVGHRTT